VTILGCALTDESRRFIKGFPAKGSWLLRLPNLEFSRLAELLPPGDTLHYQDQRVETLDFSKPVDLVLVYAALDYEPAAREAIAELDRLGRPHLLFGPLPTSWQDSAPDWTGPRVRGDLLSIWPEVRSDVSVGLKQEYLSPAEPAGHACHPGFGPQFVLNTAEQRMNFQRGCSCPEPARAFCTERLYFGDHRLRRPLEEVIGEVLNLPKKHITLLDEDVASEPDYYAGLFRHLWNYRKHWTVNASDRLFAHPELIRLLAKAGARVVLLNETFLFDRLAEAAKDPKSLHALYRRVKYLQSRKMLVGARAIVPLEPAPDFRAIARVLRRADLDFAELRFTKAGPDGKPRLVPAPYRPMVGPSEPAWVKNDFYSMEAILNRLARRPRRVGFYTTGRYMMPQSLAYRQDYLEGIC